MSLFRRSLHWPPALIIAAFATLFLVLAGVGAVVASVCIPTALNESQILYLFSTSPQVLAAIYGLTLTGFLFFRSELTREALSDDTLGDAVEALKSRYFSLLLFVTAMAGFTLLLCNLILSIESSASRFSTTVLMSAGQAAYATTLVSIAYFIFDVIYPKRIEVQSGVLQDEVDPSKPEDRRGSLEEFLRIYQEIEKLIASAGAQFQAKPDEFAPANSRRRIPNARLAEILIRRRQIDRDLAHRLREVITLRNSILHGGEPAVSQAMIDLSSQVLSELQVALSRQGRRP